MSLIIIGKSIIDSYYEFDICETPFPILRIRTGIYGAKSGQKLISAYERARASLLLQKLAITRRFGSSVFALVKIGIENMQIPQVSRKKSKKFIHFSQGYCMSLEIPPFGERNS